MRRRHSEFEEMNIHTGGKMTICAKALRWERSRKTNKTRDGAGTPEGWSAASRARGEEQLTCVG